MTRISAILPVVLTPLLLAGCFPNPNYRGLPNASVIQSTTAVVETVAVADTAAPTEAELTAIAAARLKAGETGVRVRVRLPQGTPVPPMAELLQRVAALGIDPGIAVIEPAASPSGTALVFVRTSLTGPNCADMVTKSEEWSAWSRPRMSFGCANYNNFVHMVEDPADVTSPRRYDGLDGAAAASGVARYKGNTVTPLRASSTTSSSGGGGSSQ